MNKFRAEKSLSYTEAAKKMGRHDEMVEVQKEPKQRRWI